MSGSTLEVLAEPNRRRILLPVLREAGLVEVRADAQRRLYRVRPEPPGTPASTASKRPSAATRTPATGWAAGGSTTRTYVESFGPGAAAIDPPEGFE